MNATQSPERAREPDTWPPSWRAIIIATVPTLSLLWPTLVSWIDVRLAVAAAVVVVLTRGPRTGSIAGLTVFVGYALGPLVTDERPWTASILFGVVAVGEVVGLSWVLQRSFGAATIRTPAGRVAVFVIGVVGVALAGGSAETVIAHLLDVDDPTSTVTVALGVAIAGGIAGLFSVRAVAERSSTERSVAGQLLAPLVVVVMTLAAIQVTRQIGEQRDRSRLERVVAVARSSFLEEIGVELTLAKVKIDASVPTLAADVSQFPAVFGPFQATRPALAVVALIGSGPEGATRPEPLVSSQPAFSADSLSTILESVDIDAVVPAEGSLGAIEPVVPTDVSGSPVPLLLFTAPLPPAPGSTGSQSVVFGYSIPVLLETGRLRSLDDVDDVTLALDRVVDGIPMSFTGGSPDTSASSATSDMAIGDQQYRFSARPSSAFGTDPGVMSLILGLEVFFGLAILVMLLRGVDSQVAMSSERRRRESLLEAALDATPGMSVVFDENFTVLTANRSIRDRYADAIPGLPVSTLFGLQAESGRERLIRDALQAALEGRAGHAELADEGDGTGMRITEVETYPVHEAGDVKVGFLHAVDATERRSLAMRSAQSERMESLGALAGGLAHDFNNLLFVTLGNLQLLAMNEVISQDEKLSKFVSRSMTAVERGAEITKSLLAVARSQPLEESAVSLADLVKGLLPLVRQALGAGRRVEVDIQDPSLQLMVDAGRLSSCILNLAFNSRDAMGPTGTLTITAKLADDETMIELSVADDGAGMPADVVARAFEPFFTTKSAGSGTGLGLATVYAFAKQSGGTAYLDSHQGQGTTVTLVLPRFTGESQTSPTVVQRRAGRRVVVADDEQSLAEMVASWLIDMGIDARFATSPKSALELIEEFEPDVLVSDANFGEELDGIELARLGTAIVPEMAVVFMTGFSNSMRELQELGERTLAKPFSREDLYSALSPLIAERDDAQVAAEQSAGDVQ
ncbi:MAG: ATP-binding protein [Ilumatobacteraceae bacterium]